jgi:hypothetical protein
VPLPYVVRAGIIVACRCSRSMHDPERLRDRARGLTRDAEEQSDPYSAHVYRAIALAYEWMALRREASARTPTEVT